MNRQAATASFASRPAIRAPMLWGMIVDWVVAAIIVGEVAAGLHLG